jgi:hypothetical protein
VSSVPQVLLRWGLDCDSSQSAHPPCPSGLLPLDQRGRMMESPVTTQNSIVSIHNTSRQVLDYSTRGAYLLRCGLGHLQLLGDTFARHIARLSWRQRETSLQASRWILDKGDVGQPRSTKPRPQLKPLLQRPPSSSSDVSSMVTVSLPSPTSRRSFALPLPSSGIFTSYGGEVGSETNLAMSSCSKCLG